MSDTILSGRWVVYYESENRQKRIWRDTSVSATTTDTVNALYSALQNHFDELGQMDDGVPMSAQTPTEYTIGIIDAGDKDPWFIDRTSVEYLTGGALKTASWDRATTTNVGVVRIAYTIGTDFDTTDIGRTLTNATGADSGTLLDFNTTGAIKYAWVRPATFAAANDWDSTSGTLAVTNDSISQVWQVLASGPTYSDQTIDANDVGANDWTIFPAGTTADYAAIGYSQKFKKLVVNVGTVGTGTYTVTWQYWNGSIWTALSGVSDGTTAFKTSGTNNVTFTVPTDWTATSLNGSQSLFYIRALKDTGTVTQAPLGTQGFIGGTVSATQSVAAVSGGESLWANIYSIGTIESNTHLYIQQNSLNLTAYKATTDWWADGHIDILVNVKELGTETDEGYIKVFARQYSKTYSYYTVDLTTGGRNPIPLQTGADLDNTTGYKTIAFDGGNGSTLTVGDVITISSSVRAILTAVTGPAAATGTFNYYLIGDPITDFSDNETFTATAGKSALINGVSSAAGPAALGSPPTVTFGGLATGGSADIDENGTAENYSITLDCNQNTLANVYEYTKYITRRGNTGDIDAGSLTIEGQFYLGNEYRLKYSGSVTGTIVDGNTVTQETSGATGIVVNHNTTDKIIMLRNTRGTFGTHATTYTLTDGSTSGTVEINTEATAVTPIAAAPFGTFAGGTFFVATGVLLSDYLTTEANKFQLKTDEGTVVQAPTKVTLSVGNTRLGDKVAVFRLSASGGSIIKNRYSATAQSALATTAVMSSSITADEPGKSAGGIIRLVDTSASAEYRIRFSSWSSATFTLANQTGAMDNTGGSTTTTNIHDNGKLFLSTDLVKVGDLVVNATQGNAVSYVTAVVDDDDLTISPAITGQASGDTYYCLLYTSPSPRD